MNQAMERHPRWNGGINRMVNGYIRIKTPGHARACPNGYVYQHILVAERALGASLPPRAVVHHHNGNRSDNRNQNLVICDSNGYHLILHKRMRALAACGDASKVKCRFCKQYDSVQSMSHTNGMTVSWHSKCHRADSMQRRAVARKEAA